MFFLWLAFSLRNKAQYVFCYQYQPCLYIAIVVRIVISFCHIFSLHIACDILLLMQVFCQPEMQFKLLMQELMPFSYLITVEDNLKESLHPLVKFLFFTFDFYIAS